MTTRANTVDPQLDIHGALNEDQVMTVADEANQLGGAFGTPSAVASVTAFAAGIATIDNLVGMTADDVGSFLTISGAASGGNNGTFLITAFTDATEVDVANASGVAGDANNGSISAQPREAYSLESNLNYQRTDRKLIKGTTNYYDAIPTYERPSAVGTPVPKNLTNMLPLDSAATVRNVVDTAVLFRPSIGEVGTGTVALADETITFSDFHFVAGDVDSFITLTDNTATGATGSYRIKAVTDGQTLELDGLAVSGAGTVDWALDAGKKGIASTRGYADAVDRRGIPIADAGAEDVTEYDATFADIVGIHGVETDTAGIPTEEDGDRIFARSFGDEKDPNNTATNEGARFFIQLLTGENDVTATDSLLESIAGRSGSAASVGNGTVTVTGLTGMSAADIGLHLTLFNTAVDGNQRHAEIVAFNSASSVDVAGANFATDANDGSIEWSVSRHHPEWNIIYGDRYRNDELDEAWARTTLISGTVSDAALVQELIDLREFVGAGLGETTPTLTNTGNFFVWSDLANIADTDLEEMANELNEQIGNRDYTGAVLSDGQTITASLQALSDAIGGSSVTRVIERLVADVLKNVAHTIPGGNTYTVDGTFNGLNMWVFWRGQLRDPGSVVNGDDYDETSTTQITPYEKVKAGEHINYFILQ